MLCGLIVPFQNLCIQNSGPLENKRDKHCSFRNVEISQAYS